MRPQPKVIKIADWPFQILCYGRYRERDGHKNLSEMQKRVRHTMSACDGDRTKVAEKLGIKRQTLLGHIAHIQAKGWSI